MSETTQPGKKRSRAEYRCRLRRRNNRANAANLNMSDSSDLAELTSDDSDSPAEDSYQPGDDNPEEAADSPDGSDSHTVDSDQPGDDNPEEAADSPDGSDSHTVDSDQPGDVNPEEAAHIPDGGNEELAHENLHVHIEGESVGSGSDNEEREVDSESENDDSDGGVDDGDGDNDNLYEGSQISVAQYLLAILTFFVRHKLTGQALGDLLNLIAMICPPGNHCVQTLYKFKKYFSMIGRNIIVFHYFCSKCESQLGSETDECEHCDNQPKVNCFLELPIISQLQSMFSRPGFYDALQFRFQRVKKYAANLEDIYDGQMYQDQMNNGFLRNPSNISFLWYSDGLSIFKSSNFSVWPMYLVCNELNYKMRTQQENIVVAGLWFGATKPNPNIFLSPLNNDLETLQSDGHVFQRHNNPPVLVKAKMLCAVCDLQAMCRFMRFKQWNGYFGCTKCMISGERFDLGDQRSIHVYPYTPNINLRRNEDIPVFAQQAVRNRQQNPDADVYGVKGPSLLFFMLPNLIKGMGLDAMHGIFLGLMKLLTSLWFDAAYRDEPFSVYHLLDVVDDRLKNFRPPSNVQKLPRSIRTQIAFWKALEYKLWFFYYSLPALLGILPEIYWQHHCKVVSAIAILHQESISFQQLAEAQDLLNSYLSDFQRLYSLRYMSLNVHHLIHYVDVTRNLGPLWVFDCFFFEDLNGSIARLVHGSRHAAMQICSSVSAFLTLPARLNELDRNNIVRTYCERLLKSGHTQVKITYEINPLLQVVGSYQPCNAIPPLEYPFNILANLNIDNGRCQYFHRLRKKGFLYVDASYPRDVQKLSCYAVINNERGEPNLCKINNFLRWTPCREVCEPNCDCPARFFCIVELFQRTMWDLLDVPDVTLWYLDRVVPTGEFRAFPVESLTKLCFFMKVNESEYIASPVNTLQVE